MHFCRKLYVSRGIKKKLLQVKWKLKTGRPQPNVYVITLAKNNDLLEIYHSAILKQRYFRKKANRPVVVGLADSYSQAIELVTNIIQDVWNNMEGYDIKSFFINISGKK